MQHCKATAMFSNKLPSGSSNAQIIIDHSRSTDLKISSHLSFNVIFTFVPTVAVEYKFNCTYNYRLILTI
jgi:hypothetical protein